MYYSTGEFCEVDTCLMFCKLELVLKNIVCKNNTIATEVIQCVCIHACVFLYTRVYQKVPRLDL